MDQIIVLQGGRISEVGTYDELQDNQGAFAEFLKTYANEKQDGPEEDTHQRETHHSDIHEPEEGNLLTITDMDHMMGSTSELDAIVKSPSRLTLTEIASTHSNGRTIQGEDKTIERVINEETSEIGRVRFSVFYTYAKATGLIVSFLFFLFLLASEGSIVSSKIWLARWSSDNVTTDSQRDNYLFVYGALGLSQAFCMLFSSLFLAYGANVASNVLHDRLIVNIMHSPMSFFESTPLGRIVNRFSKDMYVIDETVPNSLMSFWRCFFAVMSAIFAISYATPIFLSVVFPLMVLYVFIQRLYVASSRQLRRIESVSRSPIYSNFLETINGTSTIRAYSQQQYFIRENYYRVDENQVAYYPWISSNRWLAIRLELIGNFVIFFASLFVVIARDSIESGLVGLSLTHAFQITQTLNWMVRMSGELETNIVAVERVKEYSETPREAAWIVEDNRPPEDWPGSGHIAIETFDLRYRENLPLVLKNINCDIAPGEKIGLVGRTGAGKSSLSMGLFRILESTGGRIIIDDIDISKIGLQDLRSRLTIIPQDPVLFSGTLRFNLDPFDKYSDEELWKVLEVSHLKQFVSGLAEGLQHSIAEGGENLSVGQRQLVCLARALLRKSKVLVLDEATAAVDLETDELIQKTIRTEFADRTVLTIAHRLNTIMDYSRILVLDKGFVTEFDSPSSLLSQKGMFYNMTKDAGLT
ncbi:multidrug resistance-associated protein 1-like [Actinia tenebrosa]|uniref:ABC-type glutathione-S-conjugate transporter n=1 Tax=Actinia tenebrosa TaxID=6105 RepID=A0A6P8I3Y3_ACTTE|nr:multidrug resistance-associated protein 1-like [Actinia tenebrosa]